MRMGTIKLESLGLLYVAHKPAINNSRIKFSFIWCEKLSLSFADPYVKMTELGFLHVQASKGVTDTIFICHIPGVTDTVFVCHIPGSTPL